SLHNITPLGVSMPQFHYFVNEVLALRSKATTSLIFSLLSFIRKRQFERREKNEERKMKRTKGNDNLLSKIVVSFWWSIRDLNP
ncbi:MAG: hypothetical protein J6V56_05375, partial [Clostridia bacterium]|nr:hypothetical protein [Clostridia bacterium]